MTWADSGNTPEQTSIRKEEFLEAFMLSNGIIAPACEAIEITRNTYYRWMELDEDFKKDVDAIGERQIDFVESQLQKNILNGSVSATTFYLSTKGKNRGYITSTKAEEREAEEFTDEDQKMMNNYVLDQVEKLSAPAETSTDLVVRLKAEAKERLKDEDEYDDDL